MTAPILAIPTEHGRYYVHPTSRSQVPSITNITGMKFKPLFGAGLKRAANYAADNIGRLAHLERDEVYKLVANPPRDPSDPANLGDIVHAWIDRYIKGETIDPAGEEVQAAPITARRMFGRFLRFVDREKPDFTASEFTVWSNKHSYAGTADWSARMTINGSVYHVLADTKTGRATYAEVAMQVAAIQNADFILDAEGVERPIPRYDRYAVLHLRPMSYSLKPILRIDEAFKSFLHLRGVFDWHVNHAPYSVVDAPKITA